MAKLPTRDQYFNIGAQEVFSRSAKRPATSRLSPEEVFTEGSDINIINASSSAMADEVTRQFGKGLKVLLLDGASDEDLDRLVADRYSTTVKRKDPTAAVVTLTYTRTGDLSTAVVENVGKKIRTEQGTEFELLQSASIPIGSTGPVSALAQATQTGTTGNVAIDTITKFVDAPSDPLLSVTNAEPATGGDDRETDARLRERARRFYITASKGTTAAIEFGALTVAGVRSVNAVEIINPVTLQPAGPIQLFIADSNGQANSVLIQAVQDALVEFRCLGIVVDIISGTPTDVAIQYELTVNTGINQVAAAQQLSLITINAINNLGPGDDMEVSLLFELARSINGARVGESTIVLPTGDIIASSGKVFRTNSSLVLVATKVFTGLVL